MQRYEFRDSSSQKFWEVGVDGNTLTVRFGKIGTNGQTKTKTLASAEAAENELASLIKEKTGKGYVLCGQDPTATAAALQVPEVPLDPAQMTLATGGVVGGLFPIGSPEAAVILECLRQLHVPGHYLAAKQGLQTLNRMGGLPSLPADVEWPVHLATKRPLHFLAQVDLSTLPSLGASRPGTAMAPGLPSSGMLFFFIDMGGDCFTGASKAGPSPGARVLYAPAAGIERAAPAGLPQIGHDAGSLTGEYANEATIFEPRMLQPFAVDSLHDVDDLDVDDLEIDFDADDGGLKASAKALAKWAGGRPNDYARHLKGVDLEEFWETFSEIDIGQQVNDAASAFAKWLFAQRHPHGAGMSEGMSGGFTLLGAPIGGFHTAIEARQKSYVSLLSVAGHMLTPSYYEDGVFYFWIKPDDLAAARFERAWVDADHS
jgi:predicted DNA-binding WGR domain protein